MAYSRLKSNIFFTKWNMYEDQTKRKWLLAMVKQKVHDRLRVVTTENGATTFSNQSAAFY